MITGAAVVSWARAHWRIAALVVAAVVVFLGGRASVHVPTVTEHQTEQQHQQAAEQHQAQQTTTVQQVASSTATEHVDEQLHAHVHQVERVARSGAKVITTDTTFDDDLHVDEAQQVAVQITFGSVLNLQETSSSSSDVHRETTVTQAPDRPLRIDFLAGIGTSGPIYGVGAAWHIGDLPLVHWPVWLGAQVQLGGAGPAGLGTLAVQP